MNSEAFKIIVGDDPKLIDYIIHKNYSGFVGPFDIDNPIQSRQLFIGKSFLDSTVKKCYVCKNLEAIQNAEKYWDDLASGKFCKGHMLLLVVDKIDSRTKFAKKFKNSILNIDTDKINLIDIDSRFELLKKSQLTDLFKNCNYNVTKTLLELDKIIRYAISQRVDSKIAYTALIEDRNLPCTTDDNVFNLVEDIIKRDTINVYTKLNILNKTDFDFSLLVNLYNTFRNLYIYEECSARGTLSNSGLSAFTIKTVAKFHNMYTKKQLLSILKFLQRIDADIKQGTLSSEYALDYMIIGVLSS